MDIRRHPSSPFVNQQDDRTKLAALAVGLVEHARLVVLVAVPLYLNLHSARVFEENKVPLLRSFSLLSLLGLIVFLAERRGAARRAVLSLWRAPIVRPALALALIICISTIASVTPVVSLFGAYHRLQGAFTFFSYLPFFFAPILLRGWPQQAQRLTTVVLFGSLPVAFYAVVQWLRYDPLPWGDYFPTRAHSTAGNPIFLGAYLIMVIPFAVARVLERWRTSETASLGYLALLALQIVALLTTQSRGPFVGFGVALSVFGLCWAALRRNRWLPALVLSLIVSALVLVVALSEGDTTKGLGRLFNFVELTRGTGRVRTLLWQSASDLILGSDLKRLLIGSGPDTQVTALTPHYPAEVGQYENLEDIPDRAHNEALDSAIAIGVLGCAAEFLVFFAVFSSVLKTLGLIGDRRAGVAFALLSAGGAMAGVLLPYWIGGSLRFAGVGVHGGIVAALLLFLFAAAVGVGPPAARTPRSDDLLLTALLAAAAAHVVETGFGIAVSAPRLYFWTYAGLAAALALPDKQESAWRPAESATFGLVAAAAMIIMTVDGYMPALKRSDMILLLASVALPTWIGGALLMPGAARGRLRGLGTYVVASMIPSTLFALVLARWLRWQPATSGDLTASAIRFAYHISHAVTFTYVALLALLVFGAWLAMRTSPPTSGRIVRSAYHVALYSLPAVLTVWLIVTQNLAVSRADILSKQASYYEGRQRFDVAARLLEQAIRLQPLVDVYQADLGRQYSLQAKLVGPQDAAQAQELFARAEVALASARGLLPPLLAHTRNLARLHGSWAEFSSDPGEAAEHRARAELLYAEAARMAPTMAVVLNEWALMQFQAKNNVRALELLGRSLNVAPLYPTTLWLRANVRAESGDLEGALADYDRANEIKPRLPAVLSGKSAVLVRLGRFDEAIAVNRELLKYHSKDLNGRRNLAFLFRERGDRKQAIEWAKRALEVAPAADEPDLDAFIADLERPAAGDGAGRAP